MGGLINECHVKYTWCCHKPIVTVKNDINIYRVAQLPRHDNSAGCFVSNQS